MPREERLQIAAGDASFWGRLHLPDEPAGESGCPVVLCCDDLLNGGAGSAVLDELAAALAGASLAVATFSPADATASLEQMDAGIVIERAAAAFDALSRANEIDSTHRSLLGYSAGAITAACLAGRSEHVDRICLLAPRTTEGLAAQWTRANGGNGSKRNGAAPLPRLVESLGRLEPAKDLAAHDRPTMILHGAADRDVPPGLSLRYLHTLQLAGHDAQRILIARGDHAFTSPDARSACVEQLLRFFTTAGGNGKKKR